jgi:hypothetical protein
MIRNPLFAATRVRHGFGRASLALAFILGTMSAAPARADNLDAALLDHAHDVISYLQKHHYHNVGILKFRIKKGNHASSFKVGPLNDNIADRLEWVLIAKNSLDPPNSIGVIHNADHVALEKKIGRYDNPATQRALFQQNYSLAWAGAAVKPDYMLTGIITVQSDLKSANVTIEGFGPSSPKYDKVASFQVRTDRSLLADLNESFHVKARQLGQRKTRALELDEEAVSDAAEDNSKPQNTPASTVSLTGTGPIAGSSAASNTDDLLYYEIRYDGQPQPVTSDPNSPGELQVAEPRENQAVSIYVRSQASERIGVAVTVNGKNTLYEEQGEPSHLTPWILDPGQLYGIYGYQIDNNTRKPFVVLSDAQTAALPYSPNLGQIQFHIFKSGGDSGTKNIAGGDNSTQDDPSAKTMNISVRGLDRSALVRAGKTRSLAELQDTIKKYAHLPKRKGRGAISEDDKVVEGQIQNADIPNPVLVQTIVVRYYKPKGQ